QTMTILVSPENIKDKENSFNTMLWNYAETKKGIDFLYEKSLWIFKSNEMKLEGISVDQWFTADAEARIVCPSGTEYISFETWRPADWNSSYVNIKAQENS